MKKRIVIIPGVIILIAIIIALFILSRGRKDAFFHTTGIVEGTEINISSKVAERISELCCKEGDNIKEGDIIIRLESDDIVASVEQAKAGVERAKAEIKVSESSIENSKANIEASEAEIKNAEAEVEKTKALMEEARRNLERSSELYRKEFISKADLDLKTTNYDTAVSSSKASKAKLRSAIARKEASNTQLNISLSQLSSAKARLKESEAALNYQMAKLSDTVIKSPSSGTVVFNSVEKGEMISPGTTIVTIVDLNNLWVRVDIEETFIGFIGLGSEAIIRIDGIKDRIFKGRVSDIGRYAEFATQRDVTRGRQDIKTFRVKIKLEDSEGILKPGMTVNVDIPRIK